MDPDPDIQHFHKYRYKTADCTVFSFLNMLQKLWVKKEFSQGQTIWFENLIPVQTSACIKFGKFGPIQQVEINNLEDLST